MAEPEIEQPISFNRQIAALAVGGSVAVARRLERMSAEASDISAVKTRMRNSINPAVSKIRKRMDAEFCTDTGEFVTQDGHLMVLVTVTRTN